MEQIVDTTFDAARAKVVKSVRQSAATCEPIGVFNASAVRARAGILNLIIGTTIFLLLSNPELDPVIYVVPFLLFDMIVTVVFGLRPVSPTGNIGTLLTMGMRPV